MQSAGHIRTQDDYEDLRRRWAVALAAARNSLRTANQTQRAARRTSVVLRSPRGAQPAVVEHRVDGSEGELAELRNELEQMRLALETRDLIWSAKTIIAASTGADPDEAHRLLVSQSQHENRKLREVAADIVDRHQRAAS